MTDAASGIRDPATHVRFLVITWLCLAAFIIYIHRVSLSVAEKDIRTDLNLTEDDSGLAMNAFLFSYALFQIPAGLISHRWGTRRALPLFVLLSSGCTALMGLSSNLAMLFLTRFGLGAAQAGIFVCATVSISHWFASTARALPSGLLGSAMSVGGALGAALTGLLLKRLTWPWVFALFALPGLVWSAWFYLWFRDSPRDHPDVNAAELALLDHPAPLLEKAKSEPTPWAVMLASPMMIWICGQQFFRAAAYFFFMSWFPTFLKETRHVSTADAGMLTSLPLMGVVMGSLSGGALSDWLLARTGNPRLSRQGVAIAGLLACTLCIVLANYLQSTILAVSFISAGSFCGAFAGACAYTITIDMGGKHIAMVFSLMNMAGNVGAMIFPALVPILVRTTGNWDMVLFALAGAYLAGAVCWAFLNPNRSIFERPTDVRS